ncbi:hypothetical protein BJX70DRAFT_149623 [Aspergillus crustosus]
MVGPTRQAGVKAALLRDRPAVTIQPLLLLLLISTHLIASDFDCRMGDYGELTMKRLGRAFNLTFRRRPTARQMSLCLNRQGLEEYEHQEYQSWIFH